MARLDDKDKQLLGDAGLGLSDAEYIAAVAGLGSIRRPQLYAAPEGIFWTPLASRVLSEGLLPSWSRQELLGFAERWENVQKETALPRVVITDVAIAAGLDVFSLFRVLNRPEARTRSVFLEADTPQADLRFQMPMRVGAWPDDFEDLDLAAIGAAHPASSFMEFHPLSREHALCEVLILRGPLRAALQRILAAPFAVRTAFVLIVGPVDLPWQRSESLLAALLSETRAAGVSLITLRSSGELAGLFQEWSFQLSHNEPFDISLKTAFHETAALHLLSRRLIEAASLPTVARMLGRRIDALPPLEAAFDVSAQTLDRIDLQGLQAASATALPTELARTLRENADILPYARESEGATALAEISSAEKQARSAATTVEPNRVLQADLFAIREGQALEQTHAFVIDRPHRMAVFIGPPGGGALEADEVFPDKQLDWQNADQYTLGVVFSEPNQWEAPQTGELVLGRFGTSTRCRFDFTPTKAGPFRARITIHYRGRVLQTALLETSVEASDQLAADVDVTPSLSVEAQIHGSLTTLDDRRRFDANLVLNHTVLNRSMAQMTGQAGAAVASLDSVKVQLEGISAELREVADKAKRYSKGLKSKECTAMLVSLATHGNGLFRRLVKDYIDVSSAAKALRDGEYLQIVTMEPDAVVPLELVYAYAPPAADAEVCPRALDALEEGKCPAECDKTKSPARHVCPMGFWGLSKVIERHAHYPELTRGKAFIMASTVPIGTRNAIPLRGAALLAASNNVGDSRKPLEEAVSKQWKAAGTVKAVKKWSEWVTTVDDAKPTLLIALAHSEGANDDISLEISGDTLVTRFVDETYISQPDRPPPLVLLLGCDVVGAGDARTYSSHVANFRGGGAPVILGTLAVIHGADAATATGILIEQLVKVVSKKPDRFGEVLRQAKREAMKKGLLMVLGLVGFGDADWQLKM